MLPLVGVSETIFVLAICGLVVILFGLLALLAVKHLTFFKMGMRNTARRYSQTFLIVFGLMLSTILITTSLVMGASVNNSAKAALLPQVGNLDEGISKRMPAINPGVPVTTAIKQDTSYFSVQEMQEVTATLLGNPHVSQVVGAIATPQQSVPVFDVTTQQISAENALIAVPPDFSSIWGALQSIDGHSLDLHHLGLKDVYIGSTLAKKLDAHVGDTLRMFVGQRAYFFTVVAILNTDVNPQGGTSQMLIVSLAGYQQLVHRPDMVNTFYVKNKGQGGLDNLGPDNRTVTAIVRALQQRFPVYKVTTYKLDAVTNAVSQGVIVTQAVSAIGLLVIIAGMLLIYLIFVMLASERQAEMGMSRAVGMQRYHLVQVFVFEGMFYAVISSIVGIPFGIGIAALLVWLVNRTPLPGIINQFPLYLYLDWQSVALSFCLGLLLTFIVVAFSAYRVSHMNIIVAIRNLEPIPRQKRTVYELLYTVYHPWQLTRLAFPGRNWYHMFLYATLIFLRTLLQLLWTLLVQGIFTLLVGLGLLLIGVRLQDLLTYESGVTVCILGLGLVARWLLPSRLHISHAVAERFGLNWIGIGWLLYWMQPFGPWERLFGIYDRLNLGMYQTSLATFFFSIALIVGGGAWLVLYNGDLLIKGVVAIASRLGGVAAVARTSMAYPLTYKFRTGLTIIMFALVIFITILVVVLTSTFEQNAQVDRYTGGWELQTDSANLPPDLLDQINANPLLAREIDVNRSSWFHHRYYTLQQLLPGKKTYAAPLLLRVAGDSFFDNITAKLQSRAVGYTNDRQVWNAVKQRDDLAVLWDSPPMGLRGIAPGFRPFQVQMQDAQAQGTWRRVTIIGILPTLYQWPGLYISTRTGAHIFPSPVVPTWYNFRLRPGYNDNQVRLDLGRAFGPKYGIEVETLSEKLGWGIGTVNNLGLFLTAYLALGLIIGICGLGVITSQTVVERRQQIGMLRSLGYNRCLVVCSFLMESSFIAILGLLIGSLLGLWTASQTATALIPSRDVLQDSLHLPFGELALILSCAYIATLFATYLPARLAAQVKPAEALRYE